MAYTWMWLRYGKYPFAFLICIGLRYVPDTHFLITCVEYNNVNSTEYERPVAVLQLICLASLDTKCNIGLISNNGRSSAFFCHLIDWLRSYCTDDTIAEVCEIHCRSPCPEKSAWQLGMDISTYTQAFGPSLRASVKIILRRRLISAHLICLTSLSIARCIGLLHDSIHKSRESTIDQIYVARNYMEEQQTFRSANIIIKKITNNYIAYEAHIRNQSQTTLVGMNKHSL